MQRVAVEAVIPFDMVFFPLGEKRRGAEGKPKKTIRFCDPRLLVFG
jgi:hypothetical protein